GQVVEHRAVQPGDRSLRPAARRLRLHARVPRRACLGGQSRPVDLRRHHRDHEGDHRPVARTVVLSWYFAMSLAESFGLWPRRSDVPGAAARLGYWSRDAAGLARGAGAISGSRRVGGGMAGVQEGALEFGGVVERVIGQAPVGLDYDGLALCLVLEGAAACGAPLLTVGCGDLGVDGIHDDGELLAAAHDRPAAEE